MSKGMVSPEKFQRIVRDWYHTWGRKDLPWQKQVTPYRVWVSEIMLQQTQVATVIPYFKRFMKRFPCVQDLAHAAVDEVLAVWSGLGYYARARNMHRCAQKVVNVYDAKFPQDVQALQSLPGIGRSTAGAIAAFTMDMPAPILDGNVKRVLARIHGICQPVDDRAVIKQLWQLAEYYTPNRAVAGYTQAMMDLGALVCTRTCPRCEQCPLRKQCMAFEQQLVEKIPVRGQTLKRQFKKSYWLLLRDVAGQWLLDKRPEQGIWGGLWCFPEFSQKKQLLSWLKEQGLHAVCGRQSLPLVHHALTHRQLEIAPIACVLSEARVALQVADDQRRWCSTEQALALGLPQPVRQLLKQLSDV